MMRVDRQFVVILQVLRYGPTNKYGPHQDGLERVMSVLMYLVGELVHSSVLYGRPEHILQLAVCCSSCYTLSDLFLDA